MQDYFRARKIGNTKLKKKLTSFLHTVQGTLRKCNLESIISSLKEKTEFTEYNRFLDIVIRKGKIVDIFA